MSSMQSMGGMSSADLVAIVTTAVLLGTPIAKAAAADALAATVGNDGMHAVLSMVWDGVRSSANDLARYGQGLLANQIVGAVVDAVVPVVDSIRSVLPRQPMSSLIDKDTATFPTQMLAAVLDDTPMARKLITYCSDKCESRADVLTQLDEVLSLPAQTATAASLAGMAAVRMGLIEVVDLLAFGVESYASGGATTVAMAVSGSTIAGSHQAVASSRSMTVATLRAWFGGAAEVAMDAAAPPITADLSELGLPPVIIDNALAAYNQMRYVTVTAAIAQNWADRESANIVARINEALDLIDDARLSVIEAAAIGMDIEPLAADAKLLDIHRGALVVARDNAENGIEPFTSDAKLLDIRREWAVAMREKKDIRATNPSVLSDAAKNAGWAVLVGRIQLGVGAYKLRMAKAVAFAGKRSMDAFLTKQGGYAALCIAWEGVFNLLEAVAYPYEMIETDGLAVAAGTASIAGLVSFCTAVSYVRMIKKGWRQYWHNKSAAEMAIGTVKDELLAQGESNHEQLLAEQAALTSQAGYEAAEQKIAAAAAAAVEAEDKRAYEAAERRTKEAAAAAAAAFAQRRTKKKAQASSSSSSSSA